MCHTLVLKKQINKVSTNIKRNIYKNTQKCSNTFFANLVKYLCINIKQDIPQKTTVTTVTTVTLQ